MKKKLLILAPLLFAGAAFAQQNLRSYVCIVREKLSDKTKDWISETSDYLRANGFSPYARAVKNLEGSTFGSGFVYVAPNGKNYIVTNRHVVPFSEGADASFENADGSYTDYRDLKVLASDKELDLALLEFPDDGRPFKSGLLISERLPADGDDVLTAGFPGLAGEPSWQLGTGTVTNASARIKDLVDPAVSLLIQHSAPVDAGNSGGPLLRRKSGGYEVVGINTWKVYLRQSTNISIPSSAVQRFIQQSLLGQKKKALEERKADFNAALNTEEENRKASSIERFVSKELAMSDGAAALVKTLRTAKTSDCSYTVSSFEQSPIDGFSAAVAVQMFSKKEKIFNWKEESAADGGEFCVQSITEPVVEKAVKQKKKKSKAKNR